MLLVLLESRVPAWTVCVLFDGMGVMGGVLEGRDLEKQKLVHKHRFTDCADVMASPNPFQETMPIAKTA